MVERGRWKMEDGGEGRWRRGEGTGGGDGGRGGAVWGLEGNRVIV